MIIGILPNVNRCKPSDKCLVRHAEADSQRSTKSKKSGGKGSVPLWKKAIHLGCVFQDTEPSKSKSIFRKSTKSMGLDRTVCFSKGTLHHTKVRESKGPSRGVIQKCEPQVRSPCALKFDDRTQKETFPQERCARRGAWDWAKHVYKLNNKDQATFFSSFCKFGHYQHHLRRNPRKENVWWIQEHQCTF